MLQVVDMHVVNEIISILEKFNITKELLEVRLEFILNNETDIMVLLIRVLSSLSTFLKDISVICVYSGGQTLYPWTFMPPCLIISSLCLNYNHSKTNVILYFNTLSCKELCITNLIHILLNRCQDMCTHGDINFFIGKVGTTVVLTEKKKLSGKKNVWQQIDDVIITLLLIILE